MSVEVVKVSCNSCGAALDVNESTKFVTCAHCGARLAIKHSGSAIFTDVLAEVKEKTERISEDVAALRRDAELQALDREWEAQKQSLGVRDKTSPVMVNVMSFIVACFGIGWTWFAFTKVRAPFPFPLAGLVFAAGALLMAISGNRNIAKYEQAEREYRRRREELAKD